MLSNLAPDKTGVFFCLKVETMKTLVNVILAVISVCIMAGMFLYIALGVVSGVQEQAARCSYEELVERTCNMREGMGE